MITRTEAIKSFLTAKSHADLADMYSYSMEVQVNVRKGSGERVSSASFRGRTSHSYTDGLQKWYSFRIPKKASSNPEYTDTEIKYNFEEHADGVGMTGWDWENRTSKWVGFDFDAISGHSSGLTDLELEEVKLQACEIPWVTVRKSTSGNGLHLYIFLDNIQTQNHTEHAALGRAILGKLSAVAGFDFESKVDISGGNLWVWHRKMTKENEGLKLLKKGVILKDIPANWRDHVPVIKGDRRKNLPRYIENEEEFDNTNNSRNHVKLDDEHKKLFEYLESEHSQWWFDSDRRMVVAHTSDLKIIHEKHKLRGVFDTVATGKDTPDHNCYLTPLSKPEGAWIIRRYTKGVEETENWDQDANGWTTCYYNRPITLSISARIHEGAEDDKGVFHFKYADHAENVAKDLGVSFGIPIWAKGRPSKLSSHKDGRLVVQIEKLQGDDNLPGWVDNKGYWQKIFNATLHQPGERAHVDCDSTVRHLVTTDNEDQGWTIHCGDSGWRIEPLAHVRCVLRSLGLSTADITDTLGGAIIDAWQLINEPFQEEFPGGRKWNRNAAQFAYKPKKEGPFNFEMWQRVLNRCGLGLDAAVSTNEWCRKHGVQNGADYLKIWAASLFQFPKKRLPYLFFYSKAERTGKTTFHESLGLLLTKGYTRADMSLVSSSGFNGEMENAILCAVEETDLAKSPSARNRVKDWVTAQMIMIHHKGRTPYLVENCTHIVQTGNDPKECPIFTGDTRITMIQVPSFAPGEMIDTEQLRMQLRQEAPDFLGEILSLEIPPSGDRLNLPIIDTEIKVVTTENNKTSVEVFFEEKIHYAPGEYILFGELWGIFREWIDQTEAYDWTKRSFGQHIPEKFPKGRSPALASKVCVGNASLNKPTDMDKTKYVLCHGKLLKETTCKS